LTQDYLWPTDASRWMTSSFAEYRPRRFHAAIDIKTWNRTGYKVFAIRDGYIKRIRVSPFGYGKAIYLKLDTGEIVVYAHLKKFNHKLEQIVWREQQSNDRYRVDRYFRAGALPVKKGDLLGYTGETGIGEPHLHFEMRDASNRPFNPLLKGFQVEDHTPPTPTAVSFIPLGFGSRVDNDFAPKIFKPQNNGGGRYHLKDTVSIEGEIGLAVAGYDKSDGVPNRFGLYELQLFLDGKPHFSVRYDRFNYAHNRFVELDRDYRLFRRGRGLFYHLFLYPENRLSFYHDFGAEKGKLIARRQEAREAVLPPAPGLEPGPHHFVILVRDFFGNEARIDGDLVVGEKFRIQTQLKRQDSVLVLNNLQYPQSISPRALKIWRQLKNRPGQWVPQEVYSFSHNGGPSDGQGLLDQAPLPVLSMQDLQRVASMKLSLIDADGIVSWPDIISFFPGNARKSLRVSLVTDFYDDYLRLQVKTNLPLINPPFVEITLADGSTTYPQMFTQNATSFVAPVRLREITGPRIRIATRAEAVNREVATAEVKFDNIHIPRGVAASLYSPESLMKISFWKSSLYHDLYGRIRVKDRPGQNASPELVGKIYVAEPGDVPLNQGALVSIAYPPNFPDPTKLGVYYYSRQKWVFIDNRLDEASHRVSAKVFSLETFALRADLTPPVARIRRPAAGRVLRPGQAIIIFARDDQSGFESEESLQLFIDGRHAIAEYDPENHLVIYRPRRALSPGVHQLRFLATDRSGNVTTLSRTFTVQ
ncbi:MAG: M23 family metallopeptidase, partial [Calditrichaeota bacterium]